MNSKKGDGRSTTFSFHFERLPTRLTEHNKNKTTRISPKGGFSLLFFSFLFFFFFFSFFEKQKKVGRWPKETDLSICESKTMIMKGNPQENRYKLVYIRGKYLACAHLSVYQSAILKNILPIYCKIDGAPQQSF